MTTSSLPAEYQTVDPRADQALTYRPTVPAMERRMFQPVQVLDHGFVSLVDYMGDDNSIVQAARVSYGRGTKQRSTSRGLIRYLVRNRHTTPLEMCLDGDTRVQTYPCPHATVKHYTMRELAEAFQGGRDGSWAKLTYIRTVNPLTGMVERTKIKRAWQSGRQQCFRVTVGRRARRIVATETHPFLCSDGVYRPLSELRVGDRVMMNGVPAIEEEVKNNILKMREAGKYQGEIAEAFGISPSSVSNILREKDSDIRLPRRRGFLRKPVGEHLDPRAIARTQMDKGPCSVCEEDGRDIHHIDENPHNNEESNLFRLCPKHHRHMHTYGVLKKAIDGEITSIEPVGERDVFDLETESEHHNFIAEGFVVHNCEVKLHVKLPIFIARQWIRHRTASVNEISGRYSVLDREFYIPAPRALAPQSKTNKQGRAVEILGEAEAAQVLQILRTDAERNYDDYLTLLNEDEKGEKLDPARDGLTRELARINLTLGHYTQWYWKIDLHNLLHFLGLRLDSHAQYEIRAYCQVIATMVQEWVPDVWEAFTDYRLEGRSFSRQEMQALRTQLRGYPVDFAALGMADSEIAEYHKKLGL